MPGKHHFDTASRALVAADVTLHANWGTSPVLTLDANDQRGNVQVEAKATVGASPTVAIAFTSAYEAAPVVLLQTDSINSEDTELFEMTAVSATGFTVTLVGTPTADTVYAFDYFVAP